MLKSIYNLLVYALCSVVKIHMLVRNVGKGERTNSFFPFSGERLAELGFFSPKTTCTEREIFPEYLSPIGSVVSEE